MDTFLNSVILVIIRRKMINEGLLNKNLQLISKMEIDNEEIIKLIRALGENGQHMVASLLAAAMSIYCVLQKGESE